MKDEYDLSKLKKRKVKSSESLTVRKTIRLDVEVLEWLGEEADKKGIGYQTLINMILQERMLGLDNGSNSEKVLKEINKRLKKIEKALD